MTAVCYVLYVRIHLEKNTDSDLWRSLTFASHVLIFCCVVVGLLLPLRLHLRLKNNFGDGI